METWDFLKKIKAINFNETTDKKKFLKIKISV